MINVQHEKNKSYDEVLRNFCGRSCGVESLEVPKNDSYPRKLSFHQVKSSTRSFMIYEKMQNTEIMSHTIRFCENLNTNCVVSAFIELKTIHTVKNCC